MVAAAAKNLGKIKCPCCGEPVALKQTVSGILKWDCQDAECEANGFARPHTAAARKLLELVSPKPAPAAAAPAAPAPTAKPAPASAVKPAPTPAAKPATPFSLLGL
jgi:septal ring-binding cell division protein DamX